MYATGNPKTKSALKAMVASANPPTIFSPGLYQPGNKTGEAAVEGPHYPAPHKWYARVKVVDGVIVKVLS